MALFEATLEGTVHEDGTLVLDGPTNLPAGRVEVLVRTVEATTDASAEDFFQMLRDFEATKVGEGTAAATIAERQRMQEEMEQELEETAKLQEHSRQLRAAAEGGSLGR